MCVPPQGWVECVGCADRSCYDLTQHAKATGVKLVAEKPLPAPRTMDMVDCIPQKGPIGKKFRAAAKDISEHLSKLPADDVSQLETSVQENGFVVCFIDVHVIVIDHALRFVLAGVSQFQN